MFPQYFAGALIISCICIQRIISLDYQHSLNIPSNVDEMRQYLEIPKYGPKSIPQEQVDVEAELLKLNSSFIWSPSWPTRKSADRLGVVSAVAFDTSNNIVAFHRGNREWNEKTFYINSNVYKGPMKPIEVATLLAFNKTNGEIVYEMGADMFYMPHGLTIDQDGNFWITDVATHQVYKYSVTTITTQPTTANKQDLTLLPTGATMPMKKLMTKQLELGEKFKPGGGKNNFCKPTSVAVLPDGDFFVADGYCNSRIIKFSKLGKQISVWGKNSFQGMPFPEAPEYFFAIPHSLTLALDRGLLCVADRENGRIQCFYIKDNTFHSQYHSPVIGDRLFSCAYANGYLYAVNGPAHNTQVMGFIIDMDSGKVVGKFQPSADVKSFQNPHDVIVSMDGNEIYVAELDPSRLHQLLRKGVQLQINTGKTTGSIILDPSRSISSTDDRLSSTISSSSSSSSSASDLSSKAMLLFGLLITIFLIVLIGAIVLFIRRRKRGCCALNTRNRRHAWDFPTVKSDSFKLGNLLDHHRKRGFEKLNQDASDEEPNASTNMLT